MTEPTYKAYRCKKCKMIFYQDETENPIFCYMCDSPLVEEYKMD